jgi:hypothetical protein
MARLFKRRVIVTVGQFKIDGLRIGFQVSKSLRREPNTATIQIHNLSETTRGILEASESIPTTLEAGYESGTFVIFRGDLRTARTERSGTNLITTVESGDGERAQRQSRVNTGFGPGTSLGSVLESVGKSMKVGVGNLVEQVKTKGFEGLGSIFSEGVVVSGSAGNELTGLTRSAGLDWSIQDGNLQLLPRGSALPRAAVRLTPQTGLIGAPSVDSKGNLKATGKMIAGLFPGALVVVESERVTGTYRIEKAQYSGDTRSQEFKIDIEGKVPA